MTSSPHHGGEGGHGLAGVTNSAKSHGSASLDVLVRGPFTSAVSLPKAIAPA